ncbi:hypothetical protein [Thalassospira profundimaris]|uniref:Uncharacterized protein n=1 Tax=Thalassospira profundimaris TaxID=502049 RepID=A0A367WUZ8_9PROT|nr:hypothetical protein [Thalassospira profundimaris]RCK44272.1 hypothetical protein TH30_15605 [Thalassospira profundimaris]
MRTIMVGLIAGGLFVGFGNPSFADNQDQTNGPDENGVWELNADGKADPVSTAQLYAEMRFQGGQYARNYRHQMLTGDFTCDDVVDRIAGWVDLDSPEGPKFAMLFVTNHGGKAQSEIHYLPFEQSEQFALCIHDETAPPVMSWQENSTEFMEEVIGSKDSCNFAIRVDDFMCDAPQFFYSEKPADNGDHWFFFRN